MIVTASRSANDHVTSITMSALFWQDVVKVLDLVVQSRRDTKAALRLLNRLLRNQPVEPTIITTDGLSSYASALEQLGLRDLHRPGRLRENNRAENSHLPIRLLVVDDDPTTRHIVVNYVEDHNMRAISASRREEMARLLAVAEPSLVILDLPLGEEDGLDLLRDIRSRSDVPVIIITGDRRDEIDRVVGLELGADDCITKPFGLRELLARVRAVLRRDAGRLAPPRDPARGRCRFGGWQLDLRRRRLTNPDGAPVALTKGEYALLIAFLDAPQRPLSREHLSQATRMHEDVLDRSIDVQVLRLRRKLETDPSVPRLIQTERGVGYVFALPVEMAW
jgi:two-component system OmpR family response regulator